MDAPFSTGNPDVAVQPSDVAARADATEADESARVNVQPVVTLASMHRLDSDHATAPLRWRHRWDDAA